MQIKLLVACKDERRGLALSENLTQEQSTGIAGNTTGLATLRVAIATGRPDVLVLDRALCDGQPAHGILPVLRQLSPATRILLLCEACSHDLAVALIRRGVSGCLLTSDPPSLLVKAVQAVHAGDTWFGRSALFHALRGLLGAASAARIPPDEGRLTSREEEILHLIARGLTNKEIARELDISGHTVKTHLHHIYDKLHQSGRYKAVLAQQHRSGAIAAARSYAE
jgi:DNA-binding NarL/FixJ family response regulator